MKETVWKELEATYEKKKIFLKTDQDTINFIIQVLTTNSYIKHLFITKKILVVDDISQLCS